MDNDPEISDTMPDTDVDALRSLADTVIQEFKTSGYELRHVVALANELIGLACDSIRTDNSPMIATLPWRP
jgi:hypothetical protein